MRAALKRLRTDRLDLYLLHWRGSIPLAETVEAFESLKSAGKVRHWGVSNLDADEVKEVLAFEAGPACASNQVLYHLGQRGIEDTLVPLCRQHDISIMAYSPLGQGAILKDAALAKVARKHGVTPAAVAVAWTMRLPGVISIPKTSSVARVRENVRALEIELDPDDLQALDKAFPPPRSGAPLAML